MSLTVARPTVKVRKVQSINQVSRSYYEVVGSTGNVYSYDAWADSCNCPAGQNNRDCYHAQAVREQIEYETLAKTEYLKGVSGSDIGALIRDMGLTADFVPGINTLSISKLRQGSLIKICHMKQELAEILFCYSDFTVYSAETGKTHNHSIFRVVKPLELVRKQLDNLLKLKFKNARESLFCGDGWGGTDAPEEEHPDKK